MTRRRLTETRRCQGTLLLSNALCALALVAPLAGPATAEPRPLDARVIWHRDGRVYLVAPDSIPLIPGDLLTFTDRKKPIASGEVTERLARDLVAAQVTLGSLERVRRLDRVRLASERPPIKPRPLLRIGFPGRANLLFDCTRSAPGTGNGYRTDSLAANSYRLVRGEAAAPWPGTILVRLYGESADQEIALERGELDVAVFWPGEASSRLRSDPRWQGLVYGGPRGALAAIAPEGGPRGLSADHPTLVALNGHLFRGDLSPRRGLADSISSNPRGVRFVVDPSCAGQPALQRFLDRAASMTAAPAESDTVRLVWFGVAPEALPAGAMPLFAVRCAIAVAPELRAYVLSLGPDSLADLIDCPSAGRAP